MATKERRVISLRPASLVCFQVLCHLKITLSALRQQFAQPNGDRLTLQVDPILAVFDPQGSAARRGLASEHSVFSQTHGPIRRQRAVGRARYRVLGHPVPGAKKRDTIS